MNAMALQNLEIALTAQVDPRRVAEYRNRPLRYETENSRRIHSALIDLGLEWMIKRKLPGAVKKRRAR